MGTYLEFQSPPPPTKSRRFRRGGLKGQSEREGKLKGIGNPRSLRKWEINGNKEELKESKPWGKNLEEKNQNMGTRKTEKREKEKGKFVRKMNEQERGGERWGPHGALWVT